MKQGFTLIELLAVITILSIIALIAVPITVKLINDAREESNKRSISNYMHAIDESISAHNLILTNDEVMDGTCNIETNGNITCNGITVEIDVKNSKPTGGMILIRNGAVVSYFGVMIGSKSYNSIEYNGIVIAATERDTHKGIVYLDPTDLSRECTAADVASNVNSNGTPTGITSGCMKFYVYDDSGSTYKMILDHNTSGNVDWNSSGDNTEGMKEVLDRLREDTRDWEIEARLITAYEIAHIVGADRQDTIHWDNTVPVVESDPGDTTMISNDILNGISASPLINNISDEKTSPLFNLNETITASPLAFSGSSTYVPDIEDIWFSLGGHGNSYETWQNANNRKYAWLFDYTTECRYEGCNFEDHNLYPTPTKTSETEEAIWGYWTSTTAGDTTDLAWVITNYGEFWPVNIKTRYGNPLAGVRPVIEIPKGTVGNLPERIPVPTTYKGIAYLDPTNLNTTCTAADVASNVNSNGTPTGIKNGCMKFYIYDDSGSDYKMILDHNTTPFVEWESYDDWEALGGTDEELNNGDYSKILPVTVNAQLALDTQGWAGNPRLITASEVAHIAGMDSVNEGWVKGTNEFDFPLYVDDFYWLIDNLYDDGVGSENPDNNLYESSKYDDSGYIWGYWTSDTSMYDHVTAFVVAGYSWIERWHISWDFDAGVRPVITLPKSSVTLAQ